MAKSKIVTTNEKIAEKVVGAYEKVENAVVGGYVKIEDAVAKVEGVEKVAIAFMAQKMTIEFAEGADVDAVTKNVVAAAKKVEPDCEIFVD